MFPSMLRTRTGRRRPLADRHPWAGLAAAATGTFAAAATVTVLVGGALGLGGPDDPQDAATGAAPAPVPPVSAPIVVPERASAIASPTRTRTSSTPSAAAEPDRDGADDDGADGVGGADGRTVSENVDDRPASAASAGARARRAAAADAGDRARRAADAVRDRIRSARDD